MRHEIITGPSEEMDQLILLLPFLQIEKLPCVRIDYDGAVSMAMLYEELINSKMAAVML